MSVWYSLVSLLPFEWAAPGTMYFMKHALLAVLVISPLFGLLSTLGGQNVSKFNVLLIGDILSVEPAKIALLALIFLIVLLL